jgi:hypothetical protein
MSRQQRARTIPAAKNRKKTRKRKERNGTVRQVTVAVNQVTAVIRAVKAPTILHRLRVSFFAFLTQFLV